MSRSLPSSAAQYGMMLALFTVLLWGMLAPSGNAQALALTDQEAGTPVASGTPRPAPPASAEPPVSSASVTPVASTTPAAATPTASAVTAVTPPPPPTVGVPTATPAVTTTGSVSATIVRGLSPLSFTLNGHEQVAQTTLVVEVSDTAPATRQPGWSLTLSVAQFRIAGDPARALPPDAVTLLGVTIACASDAECTMPENTVTYPLAMLAGVAVPIVVTAPGSGSGQFVITPTFAVTVPGNAYAGSYTTTIAATIAR